VSKLNTVVAAFVVIPCVVNVSVTVRFTTFPDTAAIEPVFRLRMFARLATFRVWTFPDVVAKDTVFRVRMFARLETFRVWTFPDVVAKDTVFRLRMFATVSTLRAGVDMFDRTVRL